MTAPCEDPDCGGVWTIHETVLLALLKRAHDGEDPNDLLLEEYANSSHDYIEGDDDE